MINYSGEIKIQGLAGYNGFYYIYSEAVKRAPKTKAKLVSEIDYNLDRGARAKLVKLDKLALLAIWSDMFATDKEREQKLENNNYFHDEYSFLDYCPLCAERREYTGLEGEQMTKLSANNGRQSYYCHDCGAKIKSIHN